MKEIELKPHFCPSRRQIIWVAERSQPANLNLSDHALLRRLGWSKNTLKRWSRRSEAWSDWYASVLFEGQRDAQAVLKFVGMRKAMEGDFLFWRELAIASGLLPPRARKSDRRKKRK